MLGKSYTVSSEGSSSTATNSGYLNDAMAFFSSSKGNLSQAHSGSSSYSGSNFRSQKLYNSNFYCDYCNLKDHTRAICYRLHSYPADWKGKKRTSLDSITVANLAGTNSGNGHNMESQGKLVHNDQGSTSGSNSGRSQYNQRNAKSGSDNSGISHALMTNMQPLQMQYYQTLQMQY